MEVEPDLEEEPQLEQVLVQVLEVEVAPELKEEAQLDLEEVLVQVLEVEVAPELEEAAQLEQVLVQVLEVEVAPELEEAQLELDLELEAALEDQEVAESEAGHHQPLPSPQGHYVCCHLELELDEVVHGQE